MKLLIWQTLIKTNVQNLKRENVIVLNLQTVKIEAHKWDTEHKESKSYKWIDRVYTEVCLIQNLVINILNKPIMDRMLSPRWLCFKYWGSRARHKTKFCNPWSSSFSKEEQINPLISVTNFFIIILTSL